MGELLEILARRHNDWVCIARSLGAGDYTEDAVQDMYVKLHDTLGDASKIGYGESDINTYYVYRTIQSIVFNHHKKRARESQMVACVDGLERSDIEAMDVERYEEKQRFADLMEVVDIEREGWHWYDRMLCDIYFHTNKSMRDLERETTISLTSIYNTIKNGKERLRQAVERAG